MRAKSEIKSTLTSKLTSDIWKKLQNGLLGRELIAFGAEVISENENVKDTMLLQMNPETADKNGLYMLSQMNEIPITNIKPSILVVQVESNVRTYAPYELQYNVGNVHFTNIEYTMQGKSVSLINGTHKCYSVPNGSSISEGAIEGGSETFFYDGTTTYSGIKLGNAYPDSIVVEYLNDSDVMVEMNRYSPDIALSNVVDIMYKVVTGVDGNIYIRFLKNDDTIPTPTTFKIDWLDHSADEFDVEDNEVKDGNDVIATIEYYSQGVVDDLNFMRQQLKKEMAKYNGLNTPISVENYVKGMPYVLDAKCEKGEDGLCVYVKPSSPTQDDYSMYLDFSEIAAHISLNSILFPNIKVKVANQIMFGVEISGVNDLKLQQGISSLLQERFSYTNMGFNTIINVGSILSEIYGKYGIVPTINMTIKEQFVNGKPLSFIPIKNSLKLYGVDNSVVAWEENDLLYGKVEAKNPVPFLEFKIIGSMGTMFLLMYEGQKEDESATTKNGLDTSDNRNYETYDTEITYQKKNYNKFYLYDVSTDTMKPFDGCMQNLLCTDNNPCLNHNAWNQDGQMFGNVYDFKILSTNNAFVCLMVFKNAGTNVTINNQQVNFVYWNNNNAENDALYTEYLKGNFVGYEKNEKYKGKFQTIFYIKNPLALKNYNSDSWKEFQDATHGNPEEMLGLYEGLRGIKEDGVNLNVKSNWFVHNDKAYYAYNITNEYVYITNGAKNLAITLNGEFLGMMPYQNDLYVINPMYITKVVGFEGLKESEEIYRIYKDSANTLIISEIIREFDNQIAFRTSNNEIYTANGFELLGGNRITFKNLKRVFDDITIENSDSYKLGGCTKDYVTMYKEIDEDLGDNKKRVGFNFYCYEINNSKTTEYEKYMDVELPSANPERIEYKSHKVNLATFWSNDTQIQRNAKVYNNKTGELKYYTVGGYGNLSSLFNKEDIIIISINGENNNDMFLFLNNVSIYGVKYAVPLFIVRNNNAEPIQETTENGDWKWDGDGSNGLNPDWIAGFFKTCYNIFVNQSTTYKNNYNNNNPKNTSTTYNGDIIETTNISSIFNEDYEINYQSNTDASIYDKKKSWYSSSVKSNILLTPDLGEGYKLINDTAYNSEKTELIGAIEEFDTLPNLKRWTENSYEDWNPSGEVKAYKLNMVFFTKEITTITQSGYNVEGQTSEQMMATIGCYDTETNSCINDKGTETSYIRYHTQSPNNTSGSYLKLDVNEIKFV